VPAASQLAYDPEGRRALCRLVPHRLVAVPLAPQPGGYRGFSEALDGLDHLALEGLPAHLAVRDDPKPGTLLQPDGPIHGPVLHALELGGGHLARGVAFSGFEQLGRAQEAADDVGRAVVAGSRGPV
jgi:hypothetical protein